MRHDLDNSSTNTIKFWEINKTSQIEVVICQIKPQRLRFAKLAIFFEVYFGDYIFSEVWTELWKKLQISE